MPPYNFAPGTNNTPLHMLQPGVPQYAFGSFGYSDPGCRMAISSATIDGSGNAIIGVTVQSGNIPEVGAVVNIEGTTLQGGTLNAEGWALTAVDIDATTGIGTVEIAAGVTPESEVPQSGVIYARAVEVPETLSGPQKSQAFAVQAAKGQGRGISWTYEFPTGVVPGAISIQLEGAVRDIDAEYTIIGTAQTDVSANYHAIIASVPENANFVRVNMTTFTGTVALGATISQS